MLYQNRTDFVMLNVEQMFIYAVTQIAASDTHPLTFTNWELCTWLVDLCSRNTASRDQAFLSGLLATPTTISKMPRGQTELSTPNPTPKWYMKTYFDWLYAMIGIIYTV